MSVCILGRHGLLGSALSARFPDVTSYPTLDTKVVFHFGSYTHPAFEENPEYHMKATLDSFTQLLPYCRSRGIQFVYPSSALVYEKDTDFSRFKKTLEQLVSCYETRTLGLRIFPVYGPGEDRTVISQWCRAMLKGERPIVYGDGTQSRDFIYVEDAVDQILELAKECRWKSAVRDVGTGVALSFNSIVYLINEELGTNIPPQYVCRPSSYSEGIFCKTPLPTKVSVVDGIRKILASLKPDNGPIETLEKYNDALQGDGPAVAWNGSRCSNCGSPLIGGQQQLRHVCDISIK